MTTSFNLFTGNSHGNSLGEILPAMHSVAVHHPDTKFLTQGEMK